MKNPYLQEVTEIIRKQQGPRGPVWMCGEQLHFSQWQAAFNQLTQAVSRIEDEDKVGKLCAAIRAQLAAWGKAMEGTP